MILMRKIARSWASKRVSLKIKVKERDGNSLNGLLIGVSFVTIQSVHATYFRSRLPGEIMRVTNHSDTNWWEGKLGSRRGLFPRSYVRIYNPWCTYFRDNRLQRHRPPTTKNAFLATSSVQALFFPLPHGIQGLFLRFGGSHFLSPNTVSPSFSSPIPPYTTSSETRLPVNMTSRDLCKCENAVRIVSKMIVTSFTSSWPR